LLLKGKCKNRKCRYIHDPDHVSLCPRFLKGNCQVKDCPLDHSKNPKKLPLCVHFQNGNCLNDNCPYVHVKLNEDAPVCKDFALKGLCEKGLSCPNKHLYQCPEFANTGKCTNIKCIFLHVSNKSSPKPAFKKINELKNTEHSSSSSRSSLSIKPKFLQKRKEEKEEKEKEEKEKEEMEKEKEKESKHEDIILFNNDQDLNEIIQKREKEEEEEDDDDEDIDSSDEEESLEVESIDVDMLIEEDNNED